jgi:hypothetical protein
MSVNKLFRIGFHWGTTEANSYLLFAGGWAAPMGSHFYELSDGRSAILNSAVVQQVRHWYRIGGKTDIAGPGLYFSTDLFDSRDYGPDLLIIHFHAEHLNEWDGETLQCGNFKTQADQALLNGSFSSLPLMSCLGEQRAFVIYRAQSEGRNTGVRISFHPPSAEDVVQVWRLYTEGKTEEQRCQFFSQIASRIGEAKRPTRPAEIMLHRLLCDHATEYLLRYSKDQWEELGRNESLNSLMPQILFTLRQLMPQDQRTRSITQQWESAKQRNGLRKDEG